MKLVSGKRYVQKPGDQQNYFGTQIFSSHDIELPQQGVEVFGELNFKRPNSFGPSQ